jgi:hypothetical protein
MCGENKALYLIWAEKIFVIRKRFVAPRSNVYIAVEECLKVPFVLFSALFANRTLAV